MKALLAALRTSAFWTLLAQALVEALHAPVPDEVKTIAWVYIALRVVSYVVQYVFPNPANPEGGWMKKD